MWKKSRMTPTLIDDAVLEKILCPQCGSDLAQKPGEELRCPECASVYSIENGIVDLLIDKTMKTQLEAIDYDATGGITDKAIENIGRAWATVFDNAGVSLFGKDVLEVGSGTGALTLALLNQCGAGRVVATDVSATFLKKMLNRTGGENRITALRCDCNALPVRTGTFDVVVGRSILHHLLDYKEVLAQCARALREGGSAVFFEPILEGKIIVAFYGALVADLAEREGNSTLDSRDINLIRSIVRHITKAAWYPQDRDSLAKLEDKFVFTLPGLKAAARDAGFTSVEAVRDNRVLDHTYWSYFTATMRIAGIPAEKLEKYRFLAGTFENTVGAFPELVHEPMTYFFFRK